MNAAIRSVVRYGLSADVTVYAAYRGYTGLLEGDIRLMDASSVANIIQRGGTVIKTSRSKDFLKRSVRKELGKALERRGIDALVVIGGDGSFAGAHVFEKETGIKTIGVPGTIDNDVYGSEDTIGFTTAVHTAIEAIDRIRDTASSHDRLFLVEVMGRNSGFIAAQVGIGGGAESIIVPEYPLSFSQIYGLIDRGIKRGKTSSIIVVAEGPKEGLTRQIAEKLEAKGYGPRVCILGHTQRGGVPMPRDRILGSTLGASAVAYLLSGKSNSFVGVQGDEIVLIPFSESVGRKRRLPKDVLDLSSVLAT